MIEDINNDKVREETMNDTLYEDIRNDVASINNF